MPKKRTAVTLALIFLGGLILLAVTALTAADVPEVIMVENQGYKRDKKGPVKFHHKRHSEKYKVACTDCHHDYKDGKNVWKQGDPVQKCAQCHDPNKKKGKILKLNLAYHKNCKTCHKTLLKEGKSKKAPYKKCRDCHQKKKKP